ncbi:MAG: hypothetical protein NVS3B20_08730 [Polyangiales bacterium]
MKQSRVVVIVNANARRFHDQRSLLLDVDRLAAGRAHVCVTRSHRELVAAVGAARELSPEVIVLCGGDGSHGAGATAVVDQFAPSVRPILALAPGGTVGTIARSIGVSGTGGPFEGIARVLHAACATPHAIIDHATLAVTADQGAPRLGFVFGTGLVASFFELYDPASATAVREASRRGDFEPDVPSGGIGLLGAAKIVARIFAESFVDGPLARRVLQPMSCHVSVDTTALPWAASSLVIASVLRDIGLGIRVTPRANEDPQRPHVVVSGLLPRKLGPRLPRVLRGLPIGNANESHFDGLVHELAVTFGSIVSGATTGAMASARADATSGAIEGAVGPYVVDGDLRMARRVRVSAGPVLRILRPG